MVHRLAAYYLLILTPAEKSKPKTGLRLAGLSLMRRDSVVRGLQVINLVGFLCSGNSYVQRKTSDLAECVKQPFSPS